MAGCLQSLVTYPECEAQVVSHRGQLDLTSLPFIEVKTASGVMRSGDVDYKSAFDRSITNAANEVYQYSIVELNKYFNAGSVISGQGIGFPTTELESDLSGYYVGYEFQQVTFDYLATFLSKLSLKVNFTGDVDVKIFNLFDGSTIDTFTIAAVAGQIVNESISKKLEYFNSAELDVFIAFDATGVIGYKTNIYRGVSGYNASCGCLSYTDTCVNIMTKKLPIASLAIKENLENSNTSNGLSIVYSCQCDLEAFICQFSNLLAYPMLLRTAMALITEAKFSAGRINGITIIGDKDGLLEYYENEYMKSIKNVFKNLQVPQNSKCIRCKNVISFQTQIP